MNSGNLSIRHATIADAETIAEISRQTFFDTFAAYNTEADMQKFLNEQFTKGRLMLEVGKPENIFLLAYNNNSIAGYAKIRDGKKPDELKNVDAIEIARLYVIKQMIGTGAGSALMQHAIDIATQQKKEVVWLSVWEHNHRAINFYTRWGFEKFGECDFLLGDDVQRDWMMKKILLK